MAAATPALMGTEHYVYRRDGRIYVYKVGGGEPVIFLHAVGLSGWTWRKCIDQFARHLTCFNIDMPGFDHSDIPPRQYSMDDYTDAVLEVMDGLGLEQTNIVADHTGAIVAVIMAGKHPKRVKRMVLDGLPYWDKKTGDLIWERFFLPQFTDTTSYHIPVVPMMTWEEFHAREPDFDQEIWEKHEEIKRRSRLWMRLSQEGSTDYDVAAATLKVNRPTLLVYGDGDMLRRGEEQAKAGIKGSIHTVVDDSPGPVHMYQPDEFAKLSIEFFER